MLQGDSSAFGETMRDGGSHRRNEFFDRVQQSRRFNQTAEGDRLSPFGTMGSERIRTPVASKIALPMAGAKPIIGHSPAPAEGMSLRSRRTVSIVGTSLNRGTR
jgi:hypothetical protein